MASAGDQLARLLALIPWLRAHPGVTKAEAAAAFHISVLQLERDLRLAFTCELPGHPEACLDIDYLDSDRVTVLDAQTIDRPLRLVPEEAVVLLVGLRALAALPGLPDRTALDGALAKLEDAAGAASGLPAPAGATPPTGSQGAADAEQAREAVGAALAAGRRLHLAYWVPSRDEVTERDVDPLRVVSVDDVGYLEGWCHSSEAVRTFRLDRVVAATVLDVAATPPPEAVSQPDAGSFQPSALDLLVTVDLAPAARWVPEYYPCEAVEERPGGGLRVTLRTPDPRFAVRLVLRLGGDATVLGPPEVAHAVAEQATTALAAYGVSR